MSLEVEKNAKPASKKRGYWGPFIENEPPANECDEIKH